MRIEGIRDTHHLYVPSPGPHNLADLVRLPEPPYVIVQPTMGPPGPPGTGAAAYLTDLGSVSSKVPVTVTHNLGTYDVDVLVTRKSSPHPGSGPGVPVVTDVAVTGPDEVEVTMSGSGLPSAPSQFRVSVMALVTAGA